VHTGQLTFRRGGVLSENVAASTVLTFFVSFALALLANGVAHALGVRTISVLDLVVISVLGGVGSSVVVLGVTIATPGLARLLALPALLVRVPPFPEDAGALGGILSSRLASKLHLGTIQPRGWPGTGVAEDVNLVYLYALPVFTLVGASATAVANVTGL